MYYSLKISMPSPSSGHFNKTLLHLILLSPYNQDYSIQQGSHSDLTEKLKPLQKSKS